MLLRQLFEAIDRTGKGNTAVVGWGRGMGHKGHMMLASSVITHAEELGGDPYFVVSRTYGPDDPLQPEEKLAIYRKVFPEKGHIFQTATDELPDLTKVLGDLNQQGYTNAVVVVGADQKTAFQYLNAYNGKPNKKGDVAFNFDNLEVISRQETNDPSREEEGPRATPMRRALTDPEGFKADNPDYANMSNDQMQFAVWRDAMSPELSDEEVMDLMQKAKQRMGQMAAEKSAKKSKKQGVAEGNSPAIANAAKRLTDPKDGAVAKLRAAGDKRRDDQLKGRDMAKRDRTSKDEWGNLKETPRMSNAVKLQRAFQREQEKSAASKRRGDELMAQIRQQQAEKEKKQDGRSGTN